MPPLALTPTPDKPAHGQKHRNSGLTSMVTRPLHFSHMLGASGHQIIKTLQTRANPSRKPGTLDGVRCVSHSLHAHRTARSIA